MRKEIIWRSMGDMKVSGVRLYPPEEANELKNMYFNSYPNLKSFALRQKTIVPKHSVEDCSLQKGNPKKGTK